MVRPEKMNYYLNIAQKVAERGTCLRRLYGAVIVKDDEIISTGYCGAPRGAVNCCDRGSCKRQELNIPSGERYELCRSVHAEANAIIAASRADMIGSTLYLVCKDYATGEIVAGTNSCAMCKRMVINAGISTVIIRDTADSFRVVSVTDEWVLNDDSLTGNMGY